MAIDLELDVPADGSGVDLVLENGDLKRDRGLRSIVLRSLFTDARAAPGQPVDDEDPRGVWFDRPGDRRGSRLWLLERSKVGGKVGGRTLAQAKQYAEEALAWMVREGIAASVRATAVRAGLDGIHLDVEIERRPGRRYAEAWDATAADPIVFGDVSVRILAS